MSEPGPRVMARFVGPENVDRGREYLEQLDPELHRYIMDFVYGDVYAGDALDPKTRALCTVAMLASLDQQLQLGVYVRAARRQGASEEEVREVLRQVAVYAGFPSAWNALATMKKSLQGFDAPGGEADAQAGGEVDAQSGGEADAQSGGEADAQEGGS
jgi:4-carboxymuconolactone decarboxylase